MRHEEGETLQVYNGLVTFTGPMEAAPKWGGLHIRPRIQHTAIHMVDIEALIEEDVGDDGFIQRFVTSVGGSAYPIGERDYHALMHAWSEWRADVV